MNDAATMACLFPAEIIILHPFASVNSGFSHISKTIARSKTGADLLICACSVPVLSLFSDVGEICRDIQGFRDDFKTFLNPCFGAFSAFLGKIQKVSLNL